MHAFAGLVIEVSTRARIHGGGQHEPRRETERHGSPGDGNGVIFERLTHHFEDVSREFGELIEKEKAVMGERDFARTRNDPAADQTGIGDRVVRGAERSLGDESGCGIKDAGDGVDLGGLERFFE